MNIQEYVTLLGPMDFSNVRIIAIDKRGNGVCQPFDSNLLLSFDLGCVIASHRAFVIEGAIASVDFTGQIVIHNVHSRGNREVA